MKRVLVIIAVLNIVLGFVPGLLAQGDSDIEIVHGRGPVYLIAGAGGNITLSAGPDGALLVDTGRAQLSERVVAAIRQLQRQLTTAEPPAALARRCRSSGPDMSIFEIA